jgi:hypothetical protein
MSIRLPALLAWLALACVPPALPAAAPVTLPVITVRILPGTDPSILQDLVHVRPARGAEPVTLQLDLAHQHVLDAAGRPVAGPDVARAAYLQSIADKWRYIAALGVLASAHPQELRSDWGVDVRTPQAAARPWVAGTEASFVVPHLGPQRQLLIFGIGPSGHVYLLLDSRGAAEGLAVARAVPPLGAEHIVAVSAADPQGMHELGLWLAESNEGRGPGLLDTQGEILKQIVALKEVRVGVVTAYSCRSPAECAR